MSSIETRCRICTEEIHTSSISFHDMDTDFIKYKYKLKILFNDLVLQEDDTSPFLLCLVCVEKLRNVFEFRKQCIDAFQFWEIKFGRGPDNSIDSTIKIIPSVDNIIEFVPIQEVETVEMDEKKNDPVLPLVGNMKNKLNSLLKLNPLEVKTEKEVPPLKLNISKLKQNLNKQINITPVNIKLEPDDEDMPLKSLKRKLSDKKTPIKLDIFNLKNKLGTALKIGEKQQPLPASPAPTAPTPQPPKTQQRRPKKHGFIIDINEIVADKKNNIFYCKYCFKYFQNVLALKYHITQHGKLKTKKVEPDVDATPKKIQEASQCDVCHNWFENVKLHKARTHNLLNNRKTENHKK